LKRLSEEQLKYIQAFTQRNTNNESKVYEDTSHIDYKDMIN